MTEAALQRALEDSIAETLETMFFASCLAAPGAGARPEFAAQVAFQGSPSGRLVLQAAASTSRSIAAAFLGEEEDAISERQAGEVLCELANMICGSALSRAGSAEGFRLDAPRLIPAGGLIPAPGAVVHAVETGGGILEAVLEMEDPACLPAKESEF